MEESQEVKVAKLPLLVFEASAPAGLGRFESVEEELVDSTIADDGVGNGNEEDDKEGEERETPRMETSEENEEAVGEVGTASESARKLPEPLVCKWEKCGRLFMSPYALNAHLRRHKMKEQLSMDVNVNRPGNRLRIEHPVEVDTIVDAFSAAAAKPKLSKEPRKRHPAGTAFETFPNEDDANGLRNVLRPVECPAAKLSFAESMRNILDNVANPVAAAVAPADRKFNFRNIAETVDLPSFHESAELGWNLRPEVFQFGRPRPPPVVVPPPTVAQILSATRDWSRPPPRPVPVRPSASNTFKCEICHKVCIGVEFFSAHMKTAHSGRGADAKPSFCPFPRCWKSFNSEVKRDEHVMKNHVALECMFPDCGARFTGQTMRAEHHNTHREDEQYLRTVVEMQLFSTAFAKGFESGVLSCKGAAAAAEAAESASQKKDESEIR